MSGPRPEVRLVRHPWRVFGIGFAVAFGGVLIDLAFVVPFSSDTARRRVIQRLSAGSMRKSSW